MTGDADEQQLAQLKLRARSFDAWALDYDRYRPTYPQQLFDVIAQRLALPADPRVADLGSGTGKAARQMARRGWQVTAVDFENPLRQLWVTETALSTALNTAYFAEQVGLFSIVMGVALVLTGFGFAVLSAGALLHVSIFQSERETVPARAVTAS